MADSVQDLQAALESFKNNVSEYNRFNAIDRANEAVQQIRASAENDANKRAQLQNIANDLVGQLALHNTPASTMQTISEALAPKIPANPEAAAVDAATTGNKELLNNIVEGVRAIEAPREAARQKLFDAKAEGAAGIRDQKVALKALEIPVGMQKDITANFDVMQKAKAIGEQVGKLSLLERQGIKAGTARYKAALNALRTKADTFKLSYTKALNTGSISDYERKYFDQVIGSITDFKSTDAVKAAYDVFTQDAINAVNTRFDTLDAMGKNTEPLRRVAAKYAGQEQPTARAVNASAPAPAGQRIVELVNKRTGQKERVIVDASGRPIGRAP